MLDRNPREDAPGVPDGRHAERLDATREDLRARIGRLADCHPSAPDYRTSDSRGESDAHHEPKPTGSRLGRSDARSDPGVPGHRDHPDRPVATEIHLPQDRVRHILDGDGPGKPGGGHRHGTGRPGKTEFPQHWSDEAILSAVEQVARQPDRANRQSNGRWWATGECDNVRVTAVVLADGRIWTAWPEPGGPGVRQNPEVAHERG
jgi:hypothetical protein